MTTQSKNEVAKTSENKLPKFETTEDEIVKLVARDEHQLMNLAGGGSLEFANALLSQIASISGTGDVHRDDKNRALAIVAEIAPRDGIEAMLATQMASVHIAMMRHSRKLAASETIQQLDIHERTFNKLARTFTAQMEALRKHRHGGEQKITVEHVTVNDGGQAVVGNISKGGQ